MAPFIGIVRVGCAGALLVTALAAEVARAQSLPTPGTSSNACKLVDSDDDDDDDDKGPKPAWKRFAWEETCFEISGELSLVYQKQKANASRIPLISSRTGSVTNASELTTFNPSLRIDTTRNTALGELKTGFEVENNKTSAVSPNTVTTLSEAIVTWAGVKAGYTDSQMN